ncbi:signal peptidase I [Streptomyces sp. NPDC001436]
MTHRPGRGRGVAAIVLLVLGAAVLAGVTVAKAVDPPSRYSEGRAAGWQMAPTYTDGEGIYLEPVSPGKVHRGDIVLSPVPWSLATTQMNRVIAVGGDRVRYRPSSKTAGQYRLVLNGEPLDEPYLEQWKNPSAVAFDVKVPKGYLFLMGDNRMNSDGSQYANNGPVPADRVVAKVVTYPMAKLAVWGQLAGGLLLVAGAVLALLSRRAGRAARAAASGPASGPASASASAAVPVSVSVSVPAGAGERADVAS